MQQKHSPSCWCCALCPSRRSHAPTNCRSSINNAPPHTLDLSLMAGSSVPANTLISTEKSLPKNEKILRRFSLHTYTALSFRLCRSKRHIC